MTKEILSLEEIKLLVDTFYGWVRKDELLAPIFNNVIKDNWPAHLQKMYSFWQTVLLEEHTYSGAPFAPHAALPIGKEHFDRWLLLFHATLDELFTGPKAEEARWRSNKMAEMFQYKLEYLKDRNLKSIL